MTKRALIASFDAFTLGYLECLLFTTDAREFPEYCYQGEFSANWQDYLRFDMESLKRIKSECEQFQNDNGELLAQTLAYGTPDETNGRDFAYSRNGHGVSFRDRAHDYGYPKDVAEHLVRNSQACGEVNLYKHNGLIRLS